MTKEGLTWKATERRRGAHAPDWYFAVGIIAISIAATAVIFDNVLFAILVVLSTLVLFLRTLQKPREVSFALTSKGLWINKEFRFYTSLESFWVEERYDEPLLLVKAKGLLTPLFSIPLPDLDPEAIREYLSDKLYETELHEPLSKKIMEFLGF